jgi:hypothetical protein
MARAPKSEVDKLMAVLNEVRYGSGCLAQELQSFAHHVDRDAGIASVAFDRARSLHGEDPMQCNRCGYALACLGVVRRNIERGPHHGGTTHLHPIEAYQMQKVGGGECERDLIDPLEQRLGELGLLEV